PTARSGSGAGQVGGGLVERLLAPLEVLHHLANGARSHTDLVRIDPVVSSGHGGSFVSRVEWRSHPRRTPPRGGTSPRLNPVASVRPHHTLPVLSSPSDASHVPDKQEIG